MQQAIELISILSIGIAGSIILFFMIKIIIQAIAESEGKYWIYVGRHTKKAVDLEEDSEIY